MKHINILIWFYFYLKKIHNHFYTLPELYSVETRSVLSFSWEKSNDLKNLILWIHIIGWHNSKDISIKVSKGQVPSIIHLNLLIILIKVKWDLLKLVFYKVTCIVTWYHLKCGLNLQYHLQISVIICIIVPVGYNIV